MASTIYTINWRRKRGILPHEERTNKSGTTICKNCGVEFTRIKSEKYVEYKDGKHYYYYDTEGHRVNGYKCYLCSKKQVIQIHRNNGIKARKDVEEYCNKVGYETELEVLKWVKTFDSDAKLGLHKGSDIILSNGDCIEVKYRSYNKKSTSSGTTISMTNRNIKNNKYLAVKFEDDKIFVCSMREALDNTPLCRELSIRSMRDDYIRKSGPIVNKFKTSKEISTWVLDMKNNLGG